MTDGVNSALIKNSFKAKKEKFEKTLMESKMIVKRGRLAKAAIALLVPVIILSLIMAGCSNDLTEEPETEKLPLKGGLFSWKSSVVECDSQEKHADTADSSEEKQKRKNVLFKTMNDLNLETLYQSFSKDLKESDIIEFLKEADSQGIDVYLLTGEPEWAKSDTDTAEKMIAELERTEKINKKLSKNAKLKGVIFDVEPYVLDEWDEEQSELMENYAEAVKETYKKAQSLNLEMLVCLPFFYDSKGFEEELEIIIGEGCDGAAVMNYYREKEIEHVETELLLAQKYGKQLINIYEFNKPETHGVTEKNTYYKEGTDKALKNFENLLDFYCGGGTGHYPEAMQAESIRYAYHDFEAVYEVMNNE